MFKVRGEGDGVRLGVRVDCSNIGTSGVLSPNGRIIIKK